MPFSGNGTFNRLYSWQVDAANNINISSSRTDAELNGIAAGLSNCVTRDGQSPPSADLPMGGKKLTNLGNATTATDALNMATGDARYILSSATSITLSGALNAASGVFSGNATIGGTLGVTGTASLGTVNATGSISTTGELVTNEASGLGTIRFGGPANTGTHFLFWDGIKFNFSDQINCSNGLVSTTGSFTSTLSVSGALTVAALTASGLITGNAGFSGTTLGLSSTLNVTGQTTLGNVTGTPNGTAVNGLGFAGAPSTVKTANYQLAASDIGQDIAFNGTTLTCTIPAGLPNGFVAIIANINASPVTITSASDTLTWSGTTTTGNRTLGQNGEARIIRRNGVLYIGGTALS